MSSAIKHILVTDKPKLFEQSESMLVMSQQEYIDYHATEKGAKPPKIINISNTYDYLSKGYYVSLLAEARGSLCIPNVLNAIALQWKRNYEAGLSELNALLDRHFKGDEDEPYTRIYTSFFGRHDNAGLEPLARRIFDLYRFPIFSFEIKMSQSNKWQITKIETPSFTSLSQKQIEKFHDALGKFTGSAWRSPAKKKQERYWLGILHDPEFKNSASDKAALNKFISVGKKMGIWVETITKNDFASLLEYDAIFIRETTAINNHTYRFALKAEQEDIPCIDDTTSIVRCCNKVYLKELLETHNVPIPKTYILDKKSAASLPEGMSFPAVLKVPDGSFSRGVEKVRDIAELTEKSQAMLQKSEIILLQEYLPSEYDWRIGVLDNKALYASKYFMAKGHWQIYNHGAKSKTQQAGNHECVSLDEVPDNVMKVALAATKHIGSSLYGVDIKQLPDGRAVVIEVNDNPSIDGGVEDMVEGDMLYQKILEHFVKLIEA